MRNWTPFGVRGGRGGDERGGRIAAAGGAAEREDAVGLGPFHPGEAVLVAFELEEELVGMAVGATV
jgi:hypothetical protein